MLSKRTPWLFLLFQKCTGNGACGEALYTSYSLRPPWLSSKCFDLSSVPEGGVEDVGAASCMLCVFFKSGLGQFCRTQALIFQP